MTFFDHKELDWINPEESINEIKLETHLKGNREDFPQPRFKRWS